MKSRAVWLAASVAGCVALASCEHSKPISNERRVERSEDVANVYVSAYPAVPWSAIADKLEPKHELTTADARSMAAVTTQNQVSQFLSTFAAGLALGLPSRTKSSTVATAADGTVSATSSKVVDPGKIPASSGATDLSVTDASLVADLAKTSPLLGVDASTQLTVGTAVYQLARILDNQISKAIAPKGFQAHLLTFQVNLQPKGRDLPYDAYFNLTLMPAPWKKAIDTSADLATDASALPPVIVYPLVISDAMESSSVAKSVEAIRQAALSLSGIVGNVGISAGASRGSNSLDALNGTDRNSLVTVGRISDHSLRIRLGAQNQGSSTLALIPRTHNISVVVFTRAGDETSSYIDKLAVISEVTFVDTKTGTELKSNRNTSGGRTSLKQAVAEVLETYDYRLLDRCSDGGDPLDVLRAFDRGDYGYFSQCVQKLETSADGSKTKSSNAKTLYARTTGKATQADAANDVRPEVLPAFEEARLRRVAAELMTIQTDSRFSKLLIQLSPFKNKKLVPPVGSQLVLLNDDRTAARMVLRQGDNLDLSKLKATLKVSPDGKNYDLLPMSADVDADGKTLSLAFPSLLGSKLMSSSPATKSGKADMEVDPPASLHLKVIEKKSNADTPEEAEHVYAVKLLRPEKKGSTNPVSTSSSVLIADAGGSARVVVSVADWDAKRGQLGLRVAGAEVRAVEPSRALDAKLRAVPVAGSSTLTLVLGNVSVGRAVQIFGVTAQETLGDPVVLGVEPARSAGN